jgi:hypothetical protein
VAVLAGVGAHVLETEWRLEIGKWNLQSLISVFSILAGGLILAALAASWFFREQTLALVDRILRASEMAQLAFDSARMFYSYEFRHLALFAISLIGSGIALGIAGFKVRSSRREIQVIGRQKDEDRQKDCQLHPASSQPTFTSRVSRLTSHAPRLWQLVALVVLIADLFIIGTPFYPRADSRLGEFVPPAVKFLQQDTSLYRITSYDAPNEKVFNPNVGMFFNIADIRGYDSIIPRQYAELMGALAPQGELLYNRIAPFYDPAPFDSPIIRLLNVKYVLTTRPLPNAGYTLVYDDDIKIYRNERVLPRAFLVPHARVIPDRAALLAQMQEFDPTREVLLEQDPGVANAATCAYAPVTIAKYSGNEVIIKSEQACAGWLVLTDSYFPGWLAFIDEKETALYRADYNFRAVYVPAGAHTIRFKYSPVSFRAGAIGSFLGVMMLLLGFAYLAWRRFYRAEIETPVIRVAKNSVLPMATSLLMKLIDLAFALLSLRVLGPTGTGVMVGRLPCGSWRTRSPILAWGFWSRVRSRAIARKRESVF